LTVNAYAVESELSGTQDFTDLMFDINFDISCCSLFTAYTKKKKHAIFIGYW